MTKPRLLVGGLALVVAALATGAFLVFHSDRGGGGEKDSEIAKPVVVAAKKGSATSFSLGGQRHEAKLLETLGSSARIVFSSDSPSEVTLTRGLPVEVDLSSDAVADASITLTNVSQSSAQLEIAPLGRRAWDETSFETSGGFRPYLSCLNTL